MTEEQCSNWSKSIEEAMKCDCHGCEAIIDYIRDMVSQKHSERKPDFGLCIPELEHIKQFIHCALCLQELPDDKSPQEFANFDVGCTIWGFQVWCYRHKANVLHVNFEGFKHPSSTERKKDETKYDGSLPDEYSEKTLEDNK